MENVAVLNATSLAPAVFRPLGGALAPASSFERSLEFCRSAPGVVEVVALVNADADAALRGQLQAHGIKAIDLATGDVAELFTILEQLAANRDHVFYAYADTPLLDAALMRKMYANHLRYYVDYTFADGYPVGISAEILRAEPITAMRRLAAEPVLAAMPLARDSLFEVIKRDINAFDLETEISPIDQRLLRVTYALDRPRNVALVHAAIEHGAKDAESAVAVLQEHPEIMRTLPAYVSVQLVEGCPQACSYCPYGVRLTATGKTGEMSVARFAAMAAQVAAFSGDAVIAVSLWGEPSLHSQFVEVAQAVSDLPGLELIVETAGVGWDESVLQSVVELPRPPKWIVSLDASEEALYQQLRGDGYGEANRVAERLIEIAGERAYVQAVRMQQNEEQLETFYRLWKTRTENVIIQKYDRFAETLPDLQVADLSPLERHPCWHNKRDLAVLLDGTVPLCREDLDRDHVLGNLERDGIETVWAAGQQMYLSHIRKDLPSICQHCDEYYTFNN
jgi:spiro-SPASM protein